MYYSERRVQTMLKKDKLRYNEYFDMQSIFDELYQESRNNNNFLQVNGGNRFKAEYQIGIQKSER